MKSHHTRTHPLMLSLPVLTVMPTKFHRMSPKTTESQHKNSLMPPLIHHQLCEIFLCVHLPLECEYFSDLYQIKPNCMQSNPRWTQEIHVCDVMRGIQITQVIWFNKELTVKTPALVLFCWLSASLFEHHRVLQEMETARPSVSFLCSHWGLEIRWESQWLLPPFPACRVVGTGYWAAQNGMLFLPLSAQSEGCSLETCCRQLSPSRGI